MVMGERTVEGRLQMMQLAAGGCRGSMARADSGRVALHDILVFESICESIRCFLTDWRNAINDAGWRLVDREKAVLRPSGRSFVRAPRDVRFGHLSAYTGLTSLHLSRQRSRLLPSVAVSSEMSW